MLSTPNIRFKGFTEPWEQRKLGEITDVTKLAGFEFTEHVVYSDEGSIIALRGLNIKNGQLVLEDVKYIDGSNFSKLGRSKLYIDDIMFTYVGTVGEVAIIKENDKYYLAPNVSRIRVQSDDSPKFISHYMRTENFYKSVIFPLIATSSQPALSMENIRKFEIYLPTKREEQDRLSNGFDNLDNLITLHQRKCDEISKLKKFMLQKMFPKNGEQFPEIRFSGFFEPWKQRKLGDITERVTRKNHNLESELPLTISAQYGLIDQNEFFDKRVASKDVSGYYLVRNGEFAYNKSTSSDAPWGAVKRLDCYEKGVLSTLYIVFRIVDESKTDSDYIVTYYETDLWHKGVQAIAAEGARNHGLLNITPSDFFETTLMVPQDIDEQNRIGRYFKTLDHLITLHQRKCDEFKEIKKYMLQNMFPQKG